MDTGRLMLTILAVFFVRTTLNFVFYGQILADHMKQMQQKYPGMFREVIPGFIGLDFVWAVVFCVLFAMVGMALGGGVGGGVKLGMFVAFLGQVMGNFYMFFGSTFLPIGDAIIDSVYALVSYSIQGAVAGLVYKHRLGLP